MSDDPIEQAKADLNYAILTMDSYNRGYGSGITNLNVSDNNHIYYLGNWAIDKNDSASVFGSSAFEAGIGLR